MHKPHRAYNRLTAAFILLACLALIYAVVYLVLWVFRVV